MTLLLLVILPVRRMIRTGASELTITRRIGRAEVTIPVHLLPDESADTSRRNPPWWNRFRAAFETLSTAFHTIGRATWST